MNLRTILRRLDDIVSRSLKDLNKLTEDEVCDDAVELVDALDTIQRLSAKRFALPPVAVRSFTNFLSDHSEERVVKNKEPGPVRVKSVVAKTERMKAEPKEKVPKEKVPKEKVPKEKVPKEKKERTPKVPDIPFGTYGCWDYPNQKWERPPTTDDIQEVMRQKMERYPDSGLFSSEMKTREWFKNKGWTS